MNRTTSRVCTNSPTSRVCKNKTNSRVCKNWTTNRGCTGGDKIKFPLCTDSPPTCERSCQQKSPKSRSKVASDFRRTLNVTKKVADLFLSGEKIVCAHIQFRHKSRACTNSTRTSCNFAYLLHSLSPFDVTCRCLLRRARLV